MAYSNHLTLRLKDDISEKLTTLSANVDRELNDIAENTNKSNNKINDSFTELRDNYKNMFKNINIDFNNDDLSKNIKETIKELRSNKDIKLNFKVDSESAIRELQTLSNELKNIDKESSINQKRENSLKKVVKLLEEYKKSEEKFNESLRNNSSLEERVSLYTQQIEKLKEINKITSTSDNKHLSEANQDILRDVRSNITTEYKLLGITLSNVLKDYKKELQDIERQTQNNNDSEKANERELFKLKIQNLNAQIK